MAAVLLGPLLGLSLTGPPFGTAQGGFREPEGDPEPAEGPLLPLGQPRLQVSAQERLLLAYTNDTSGYLEPCG